MSDITAGLVGLSHPHSVGHARTLDCMREVSQVVVWDDDGTAREAVRREFEVTPVAEADSLEHLIGWPDLGFVVAAERNDRNPDLFVSILDAGHHLLAEKPLGRNAADARRVVAAARANDRQLAVFYTNRFSPVVSQARDLILGGVLGEIHSVEIRALTTQIRFRGPEHWLYDKQAAGGGMLSWLGCHYLDLIHFLTGDEITSVSAETATRGDEGVDVEDTVTLAMRMGSGALASLHAAYVLAISGGGYYNTGGYDQHLGVHGRTGRLWWNNDGEPMLHLESGAQAYATAPRRTMSYTFPDSRAYGGAHGEAFVRAFIAAIRGDGLSPCPGDAAVRVALVVDAAYESARAGRRITVPSIAEQARACGQQGGTTCAETSGRP